MHKKLLKLPLLLSLVAFLVLVHCPLQAKTLFTRTGFGQADDTITFALMLKIPEGSHAYSHETMNTGRPTVLDLTVDGQNIDRIFYPKGAAQRDIYSPDISVFVYEGETWLFADMPAQMAGKPYSGSLSLLLCSSRNCQPINQELAGTVPRTVSPRSGQVWAELYGQTVSDPARAAKPLPSIMPERQEENTPLPPPDSFSIRLTPEYASSVLEITTFSRALLFGILAGLILNVMPCVLPVLTFKLSGMLAIGSMNQKRRIRKFRRHNLYFAAGILTFFTLLAIILGLADMFWGQLFQSQTLILIMLVFVFMMGLSLLELFSLPIIDLRVHEKAKNPHLKIFLTGFLSTLLATPCSGPLLGGVLGWAFTQPFVIMMLVFWSIGVGMALPYLAFSIWPNSVLLLPKPGRWMNVLEHVAGFFLIGTALYLLSILPQEKYIHVLSVLLLISIAAWLWGQYCGPDAPKVRRRVLGLIGSILLIFSLHWILLPPKQPLAWRNFSPEYFTANLGQKILFVEFTADWCPNCKFMEKTVLTDETMQKLIDSHEVELIRADLTQANAWATYLLRELGSRSIPLTAIFPKGDKASSPIVLRDIYNSDLLEQSFARAVSQSD